MRLWGGRGEVKGEATGGTVRSGVGSCLREAADCDGGRRYAARLLRVRVRVRVRVRFRVRVRVRGRGEGEGQGQG